MCKSTINHLFHDQTLLPFLEKKFVQGGHSYGMSQKLQVYVYEHI